jgi:hypothetical protein
MPHFPGTRLQAMTLVEAVVLVAVYTLLMLVITTSVVSLYNSNSYTIAQANEIDTARRGLVAWTQDVREMLPSAEGTWPIEIMEPHRMGFYSDVDRDNLIEYVIFELATTTLYKYSYEATGNPPTYPTSTPSVTTIVSEYVQNFTQASSTFRYFNNAGAELRVGDLLTDIRFVQIELIVNIDPVKEPGEFMLRSSVTPRNLKDNL